MNETPLLDQIQIYSEALVEDLPPLPVRTAELAASPVVQPVGLSVAWTVVVAAAVTVIVLGGVAWLAPFGGDTPPAGEPTTVIPSPTSTVAETPVGAVGQFSQTSTRIVWGMSETPQGLLAIGQYQGSGSAVYRSTDAVTWSVVGDTYTGPNRNLVGVAGSDLGYVAPGSDGVLFSADGTADWGWVPITPPPDRYTLGASGVAASDFGFVVVGGDLASASGGAAAWFSPDGIVWTQVVAPDPEDDPNRPFSHMSDIDYSEEYGFVAVGQLGSVPAIWRSSDGRSWTVSKPDEQQRDEPVEGRMFRVAASEKGIVIGGDFGGDNTTWYSLDGNSWTRSAPRVELQDELYGVFISTVAASSQGFIAGGGIQATEDTLPRPVMWYSPNGLNWNRVAPDETVIIADDRWAWMETSATLGSEFVASGGGVWTFTPPDS